MKKSVKGDVSIHDSFKENMSQGGLGSHRPHGTPAGLNTNSGLNFLPLVLLEREVVIVLIMLGIWGSAGVAACDLNIDTRCRCVQLCP
jgi:hypothetical protein